MATSGVTERLRLAGLAAGQGWSSVRRAAGAPNRVLRDVSAPIPTRLLIAPQDIRTADPTVADEIYAGFFDFGGKGVNTQGHSPFEVVPPSQAWVAALTGFGWLRHLRAADTALARANARSLVDDWIASDGRPNAGDSWEVGVAARRVLSWLSQSPMILEGADRVAYRRFMRSLGRHAAFLQLALRSGTKGEARLLAAIALSELALCAEGLPALSRRATRLLAAELTRQILPDGGPISRNPQRLVDLLLDLLPLRQAFAARGHAAPPELLNSIDRMMPMLRMFRHGDGNLALFNGMGPTSPDLLATVLAYDDGQSEPLTSAPVCGYQRIEAGATLLVIDTGRPPSGVFSTRAHAGTLSFELSDGPQRLIVNCGTPSGQVRYMREAARSTAAHSTLVVGDASSSRLADHVGLSRWLGGQIVSGPTRVDMRRRPEAGDTVIEASHDGYDRRFGLVHQRTLRMAADGTSLQGEDRLITSGRRVPGAVSADYAIRFHLHPSVTAQADDQHGILLTPAQGAAWWLTADGHALVIEESIFFAAVDGARPSDQIVIRGSLKDAKLIAWTLTRDR